MSFHSILDGLQLRRIVRRTDRGQLSRRLRFESFEDRCLLSLTPAVPYDVGANPQSIVTGYFNDDAWLDLAIANVDSDNVSVLLGSANGAFGEAIDSPAGESPKSIAVGDFDEDGNLDLAAVNGLYGSYFSEGYVNVMFGNGNGSFQPPSRIGINPEFAPNYSAAHSVAVGDFNGDGTMDLAAGGLGYDFYGGHASVLLSNGDRTFSEPKIAVSFLSTPVRSMAVADFNDDGDQDLVVATSSGSSEVVQVLLGDGEGNFSNVSNSNWLIDHGTSMAADDLNRDGHTDLVTADGNDVNVRLGDGLGGFEPPPGGLSFAAGNRPTSVVLGDFNRDGVLDIVTANNGSNDVSILRGRGDGTFALPEHFAAGPGAYAVATADFNGDGWLDVASANANANSASVLFNDQSWAHQPPGISISVTDASVREGKRGIKYLTFTVSLSAASTGPVTVNYATQNGTAIAGSDYQARSGMLSFAAGETTKTVLVAIYGDSIVEPDESFQLVLSNAIGNAVISDHIGVGLIINDDVARGPGKKK